MESKKTYEVDGWRVEELIEDMIYSLNKRNEAIKDYLKVEENEARRILSNICKERLAIAYAIKQSLELLFNFDIFVNYGDNDRVSSIEINGKTYKVD